jgi:hypothetical protein
MTANSEFIPVIYGAQPYRPITYKANISNNNNNIYTTSPPSEAIPINNSTATLAPTIKANIDNVNYQITSNKTSKTVGFVLITFIIILLILVIFAMIYKQTKSPTKYSAAFIISLFIFILLVICGIYLLMDYQK